MKRRFFFFFFLLLILPLLGTSEDLPLEGYLVLPEEQVRSLLDSLIQVLTDEGIDLLGSGSSNDVEIGIILMLRETIRMDVLNHLLIDAPVEVTVNILKSVTDIARLVINQDVSVILEKFERETVKKAVNYASQALFQNEIRTNPGAINVKYTSNDKEKETVFLQYLVVYQPLSSDLGKIEIRFYSPNPIKPPRARIWMMKGVSYGLQEEFPPFVVKISGILENYKWIKNPSVELDFPDKVPDLGIKAPNFWERHLIDPVKSTLNNIDVIMTKIFGKPFGSSKIPEILTEFWGKMKLWLSGSYSFLPAGLAEIPLMEIEESLRQVEELIQKQKEIKILEEDAEEKQKEIEILEEDAADRKSDNEPEEIKDRFIEAREKLAEIASQIEKINSQIAELNKEEEAFIKEKIEEYESRKEKAEEEILKEDTLDQEPEEYLITEATEQLICQKNEGDVPIRKVIINEVAWMGGSSSNNEWIELKNMSSQPINLDGWQLLDKDQQIKIIFTEQESIDKLFLLERTSDDSVPEVAADLIYTGSLNNSNEALYLFDNNCILQDEILADPIWPAGDNNSKRTMERRADLSWQTSSNAGGTPRQENSSGYQEYSAGASSSLIIPPSEPGLKVLITETQIASSQQAEDEFIELYNPNDQEVLLQSWSIQRASSNGAISKKNFEDNHVILPKSYFLIVNSKAGQEFLDLADMVHNSFNLTKDNTILLVSSQDKVSSGSENIVVDQLGYGEAFSFEGEPCLNPEADQSLGRKWDGNSYQDTDNNANDFEIQEPTPRTQNKAAIEQDLSVVDNPPVAEAGPDQVIEVGQSLTLDGSGSTDDLGIVYFYWDINNDKEWDYEGETVFLEKPFLKPGDYLITLYVVDCLDNTDSDTLTIIVNALPKILISEVQIEGVTASDEFIELYNPNDFEVDISNYILRKKSSKGEESSLVSGLNGAISAKDYFLIVPQLNEDETPNYQGQALPDQYYSGKSYYLSSDNTVLLYDRNNELVDKVGFGLAQDYETSPAENPSKDYSLGRKWIDNDYQETDNNANDFEIQEPTPRAQNRSFVLDDVNISSLWPMLNYDVQHKGRAPYSAPEEISIKWEIESGNGTYFAPLLSFENNAYFTTHEGLFSYNIAADPVLNWQYPVSEVYGSPIFGPSNTIYFAGRLEAEGKYIFSINANGSLKWRKEIEGYYHFTSPVISDNKFYYIADFLIEEEVKPHLVSLNPENGSFLWVYEIKNTGTQPSNPVSTPSIDDQGNIYFSYNKTLFSIDAEGKENWRKDFNQAGACGISTAAIDKGMLYVQIDKAYAIEASTGNVFGVSYNYNVYPQYYSIPAIAPNGDIYMIGIKGAAPYGPYNVLYVFDPLDQPIGEWKPKINEGVGLSSPISAPMIDNQGTVYFVYDKYFKRYIDGSIELLLSFSSRLGYSLSLDNNGVLYLPGTSKLYAIGL